MASKRFDTPKSCTITSRQYKTNGYSQIKGPLFQQNSIPFKLTGIVPSGKTCVLRWSGVVTSTDTQGNWQSLTPQIGNVSGTINIAKNTDYAYVSLKGKHKYVTMSSSTTQDFVRSWSATLTINSATVTWDAASGGSRKKITDEINYDDAVDYNIPGQFPRKDQVAYIIDTQGGPVDDDGNPTMVLLCFDGVMKCSISSQIKTDDEKNHSDTKNKKKYVNNAMDQPDEITLQVSQSAVYTNQSYFQGGQDDNRLTHTYQYLYNLKSSRRKVSIWTGLRLFEGFMLKSMSVSLDENTTNGWAGQLQFHQFWKVDSDDDDDTSGTDNDPRSELAKLFGDGFI